MITVPDRLSELRDKLERGGLSQADCDQAATLVALDLAIAGRQFVEQAIQLHEEADDVQNTG
jgi:hypothetical protein